MYLRFLSGNIRSMDVVLPVFFELILNIVKFLTAYDIFTT